LTCRTWVNSTYRIASIALFAPAFLRLAVQRDTAIKWTQKQTRPRVALFKAAIAVTKTQFLINLSQPIHACQPISTKCFSQVFFYLDRCLLTPQACGASFVGAALTMRWATNRAHRVIGNFIFAGVLGLLELVA